MNFVFISPNFPLNYYNFVVALKRNGVNVLGIGDTPYDNLCQELKDNLTEYYYVLDLKNYPELVKAMGYFTYRYGKIDYVDSLNEYWLETDAKLRSDFNITTGLKEDEISRFKLKSEMKKYYKKANVITARWHIVNSLQGCLDFIKEVDFPVIVKPNNGVGAFDTYKLDNKSQLEEFFKTKRDVEYIMEEYIDGYIRTFDGVSDSKGKPIYTCGHVETDSLMDCVNLAHSVWYYVANKLPDKLQQAGENVIKAFKAKNRFFHLEFFIANSSKKGRWEKGDVIGLEVNMRAPGGYTVDMENFSGSVDMYQIWADMIAFDKNIHFSSNNPRQYCCYVAQRKNRSYVHNDNDILSKYGNIMKMVGDIPASIADELGDRYYMANFDDFNSMKEFASYCLQEDNYIGDIKIEDIEYDLY